MSRIDDAGYNAGRVGIALLIGAWMYNFG